MKKLIQPLSILGCMLSVSLSAQSLQSSNGSEPEQSLLTPSDSKIKYINNQDYLSKSSLKDYKTYYGDSLKGFDEAKVKIDLLSRHFYGIEYLNVMNYKKREYIDAKYKIGPMYAPKPSQVLPSNSGSKPIGNGNTINVAPCVNEDFELTAPGAYNTSLAITGWTVESGSNNGTNGACLTNTAAPWTTAISEFSILATPILGNPALTPFSIDNVTIPASPLGGNNVARLNNTAPGVLITRIKTTFPVTTANALFQFAYAGSWDGSGHLCCDQPSFRINMYDCAGAPLGCSSVSLTPPGAACASGVTGYSITNGISWCNWQVRYIDLTPYIGSCVTLMVTNSDCDGGAHHGSLYFDAKCGGSLLCGGCGIPSGTATPIIGPVSFCAGSGAAQISAPAGYATYSWSAPPGSPSLSPTQATMSTISIPNPVSGAVYTVTLVSPSGCVFTSTNAIVVSTVAISGVGTSPSCIGGASGSGTVIGAGSGTGYNYTWINATNSIVGTASVVTGLPAGLYTVGISGLGAAGCGSASAGVTITTAPAGVQNLIKPFCGNGSAYFITPGGSNYQWYNGTTAIPAPAGTASSLTFTAPTNGGIITLRYLSNLGCQDSIRYTLAATPAGFVQPSNLSWVCPGGNNGTGMINLIAAAGAPGGLNSYSVISTGTTPAYNMSNGPSNAVALPLTGLSAGSYSVNAFDGSCYYSSNFTINAFTFNYTVSPVSPTLCPGNSIASAITFTSPPSLAQYSYSWSPTTFLAGGNGSNQSTIITPSTAIGTQTTLIYTVVVTPSTVNCPIVKTITVHVVNPPTPTITAIPSLCNTSAPFQISTSPAGGTFNTSFAGAGSPISQSSGIITPSHSNIALGTNTFVYSISVNTCVASKSGTYEVSQFNTPALTSSVPALCVTNSPFNLMNIVQSTVNGVWAPATGISSNQFNPAGLNTGNYSITYNTTSSPNPTACPAFTTISVAVTNTLIPTITEVPEFCNNETPITMTVFPVGGGWLPNTNNAVSNGGVLTKANVPVPGMVVTYTVNVGPCLNSNTTTLHVSHFNSASLTGSVSNLCYNNPAVNLMSIVQNTTNGVWTSQTNSLAVQNNSFLPAMASLSGFGTNTFVLTYSTTSSPNASLCTDSRTLVVSLLNPATPTITQVGPFCNNSSAVQLSVSPVSGYWVNSTYVNATGLFTPSLSSVGSNPVQYAIGNSTCNVQSTKNIVIEAFVPATIIGQVPDLCNNSPATNLTPITLNNQGTWSGAGISGVSFNPALVGAGNFVLSYHTSSSPSGMCPDNATVAVNVYSLATPAITKVGPFCNTSLPIQLQVSPAGGLFEGPNVGIVSLGGAFNPGSALIGDNVINYSITSGPCMAYAQTTIQVEKFVSAGFDKYPGPFCKTATAINLDSYVQNSGGSWAQEPGVAGNMFFPINAKTDNLNIMTHYTHSMPTASLCPDQATISIEVREIPVVTASSNKTGGCSPVEVVFTTPNTNSGEGIWTIGDGSEPVKGSSLEHIFTTPGTYTVQFDYTDAIGCRANSYILNPVTVYDAPKVDFTVPEEIFISDPKIQFTNLTSPLNNNTYQWKITNPTELSSSAEVHPKIEFSKIGKYSVTLKATSVYGCTNELTKSLEVKNDFNIFIPNSFSPNMDGLNDVFIPVFTAFGLDSKNYEMEIFDRWGHSLFHTKDITKGWDGKNANKEESLKEEVYIYRIKYKDLEGNTYDKMGHLSLVK